MRKSVKIAVVVVLAIVACGAAVAVVRDRAALAQRQAVPSDGEQVALIQATVHELGVARNTGDFVQFWGKAARAWRRQVTALQLQAAFGGPLLEGDLTTLDPVAPVLDGAPTLEDGLLVVKARYDLGDDRLYVRGKYVREDGAWKLMGLHFGPTAVE